MKIYFFLVFLTTQNLLSQSLVPLRINTVEGKRIHFPVSKTAASYAMSSWYQVNHQITEIVHFYWDGDRAHGKVSPSYKKRFNFYSHNKTMVLLNVLKTDSGSYKLIDRIRKGILAHVILTVFTAPDAPRISSNSTRENSIIALTCASSTEIESTSWLVTRNDVHDVRLTLIDDNKTLIINGAQLTDSGTYTCFVHNPLGSASSFFQLTVDCECVKLITFSKYHCLQFTPIGFNVRFRK
ncbi:cell adhesion molecule CEACAM7-like [Scyliorhinus torazame]|uniref:cell adhesion molecule CEACAM7-like n=1 Tax=Scyliorhinus torazame TaxID=75743 RepID=UPI003B5C51D0